MAGLVLRGIVGAGRPVIGFAGRQFGRIGGLFSRNAAGTTATSTATSAATTATQRGALGGFLGRNVTVGSSLALGLLPNAVEYTFAQVEEMTGGAISQFMLERASDGIMATLDSDMSREVIAERINSAGRIADLIAADSDHTAGLNTAVMVAQGNPDAPNMEAGRRAAIAYQFKNPAVFAAGIAIRERIFREMHPDIPQAELNRHLAEGIVNDIVTGTNSRALGDEQITQEDIQRVLEEEPLAMGTISTFSPNVADGLRQIFPTLQEQNRERNLINTFNLNTVENVAGIGAAGLGAASMFTSGNVRGLLTAAAVLTFAVAAVAFIMNRMRPSAAMNAASGADGGVNAPAIQYAGARHGTASEHFGHANVRPTTAMSGIDPAAISFVARPQQPRPPHSPDGRPYDNTSHPTPDEVS